jgi:type I restriction enzyme S subunit
MHRSSSSIEAAYGRSRVRDGDVLISVKGTTGRVGVVPEGFKGNISRDVARIRLRVEHEPGYWFQLLQSSEAQRTLQQATVGSTRQELSIGTLKQLRFRFPGKSEQKCIAAVLTDVDDLIATLERLIAKKQAIKYGMMQQLLTGKTRLPGFTAKWARARLGDVATVSRGASPRPIASPRWFSDSSSVGWVRISDLGRSDGMTLTSTTQRLSEEGIARSRFLPASTLILSIAATVGVPIITGIDTCIHDGFVAIERLRGVDQTYLLFVLRSLESELKAAGQTGSQANVNSAIVGNLSIWLPSEAEQAQISAVLRDAELELRILERRLQKAIRMKQGMMQQLLTGRTRLRVKESAA